MAIFPFKKALVTGAAGDLGSVLCAELAAREVDLVITDRSDVALEEVTHRRDEASGGPSSCSRGLPRFRFR